MKCGLKIEQNLFHCSCSRLKPFNERTSYKACTKFGIHGKPLDHFFSRGKNVQFKKAVSQMAGLVPVSQGTKFFSTAEKTRAPFGWRYIGQDVITCSAVCSFVQHSEVAVEATPHLNIVDQNSPRSIQRQLSLTHACLGKNFR